MSSFYKCLAIAVVVLALIGLFYPPRATGCGPNREASSAFDLQLVMHAYKDRFQKYPDDWSEAVEKVDLPSRMIPSMDKNLAFSARYRVVNIERIGIEGEPRRIVAMPGNPAKESLRNGRPDRNGVLVRRVIVEGEDGKLRNYPVAEESLSKAFKAAGLDLADYSWKPDEAARSKFLKRWEEIKASKATKQ